MSVTNIWRCWYLFKKGKRKTVELDVFSYSVERHIAALYQELTSGTYQHGGYTRFQVTDKKRRDICVAGMRDRIVHRLVYEYLVKMYDKRFIYDAWSCRKGKGLSTAIERAQRKLHKFPHNFVWRADITKFFDNVDQQTLLTILCRIITDHYALYILNEIIGSYSSATPGRVKSESNDGLERIGMPIGNLTSQVFANIYLNEFDRYVTHRLRPLAYLRYGDDFVVIAENKSRLEEMRRQSKNFLRNTLHLAINPRNDIVIPIRRGISFLGVDLYPNGRRLQFRNMQRITNRLSLRNASSYSGLIQQHSSFKTTRHFSWQLLQTMENDLENDD